MKFTVKVIPNARKERIETDSGKLKIYLSPPPAKGRANKRLIELLAEHYGVKKHQKSIIRGKTC